jgi:hypothetical protein
MEPADSTSDAPNAAEVRDAVERMAASEIFNRSPQIVAFLRFVVESVLDGTGDRIKAYTIGVEVLRRDAKFDPQIDPIVRVEGSRLRRAIERYYSGPGAEDPVVIDLPRGSYVPTFRRRIGAPPVEVAPQADRATAGRFLQPMRRYPARSSIAAALLLAIAVAIPFVLNRSGPGPAPTAVQVPDSDSSISTSVLPPFPGLPTLAVMPIEIAGRVPSGTISGPTLQQKLAGAFARFDAISVVMEAPDARRGMPEYRLNGTLNQRPDGQTVVGFRLADADDKVVWSRAFDQLSPGDGPDEQEDAIVAELATILLQPYGVIRSRDLARMFGINPESSRYRCILEAIDASRRLMWSIEQHRAQLCLQHWIAADPGFTEAYPYLAAMFNQNFLHELVPPAFEAAPLDMALAAARRGIELNPENARAYHVLMATRFYRKEFDAAFAAGDRAISLNPYDRIILADYGAKLVHVGRLDQGVQLIMRSVSDTQLLQPRHMFSLFIASYLSGNMVDAIHYAKRLDGERNPYRLLAFSLIYASQRDAERGKDAFRRLLLVQPGWRDIRRELTKHFGRPSHIDRLAVDLATVEATN